MVELLAGAPWQQRREAVAKKLATPWRRAIGKKAQWQKCLAVMLNFGKECTFAA